jgi:CRISPR/Cas system-associated exonuclease Cas4 (RecB family)
MEVEGIHLPSEDTESGNRIHRRVDEPSKESVLQSASNCESPKTIRSFTLNSATRGLTATLDLAEVDGCLAVPVEYRKGKPQRLWDAEDESGDGVAPDRIQVGLQSIHHEEAGYSVPHAILYYAAEKRRLRVPIDDMLRSESLQTLEAAKACACGARSLPLVNDSRCPKCSLQPICLPDEVNQQR